jgi:cell division protein ZapA
MGEVMVTLGGRVYRVGCADGDVERLTNLAAELEARIASLAREFGGVGEERLLLIAALLLTDELWDTRTALDAAIAEATEALRVATEPASPTAIAANDGTAVAVDQAAGK